MNNEVGSSVSSNKKKSIFNYIIDFFKGIFLVIFYIFSYAFIGLKACTYDFFVYLYNSLSWKLDRAYKRTKSIAGSSDNYDSTKKKKQKVYKYSAKTMAKLEKEYQELVNDLQGSGATRSKKANIYTYKVRDKNGKIVTGRMSGLSKLDINSFLVNEGFTVYSIKTSPLSNFAYSDAPFLNRGMSNKELEFLLTQLSTYLKAGITLNDAIKMLSMQLSKKKKNKARALQAISYELTLGSSFSNAMEKQSGMFPALLINMIKAAEASGTLIETLDDMANYYTEIEETNKQMRSAMMYPLIISVFAIGVITFILIWVIPKFVDIYSSNGIEIKGITKVVIGISAFLSKNILLILFILVIAVIVFVAAFHYVKAFRRSVQKFLMHMPVVKNIIMYKELSTITKTFASLLRNNVYITESIDILSKITTNEIYKSILYRTVNNIVKGEKISEAFKDHWAIPDIAYFMIVTGESTGELDNMMQKVSEYYQGLHRNVVNNLKSFIEPIMIAGLALVVGGVIIAVVVPMFEMYKQISM